VRRTAKEAQQQLDVDGVPGCGNQLEQGEVDEELDNSKEEEDGGVCDKAVAQ
jgi:hypothetical protein